MASPPPVDRAAGWIKYQRFSELIHVSVAGHLVFAAIYGFIFKQWVIGAVLALASMLVLSLFGIFKSTLSPQRVRVLSHVVVVGMMVCLNLCLMWLGLKPSTAVWWLVWWPMFMAHLIGVFDGLIWVLLALCSAGVIWENQTHHWIQPMMPPEDNPIFLMQIVFLLIGAGVSVVVRRAYDRFEEEIAAKQRMIDQQNQALERRAIKLETMLQAVQQSSLERTRLFAQISHEVRTPLNGMLGFTQLLARTPLSEQQTGYLGQVNHCGGVLLQIINDVLDFSRLETHSAQLDRQQFDAVQLANEAVDMISSIAEQKSVILVREFPAEGIDVIGDPLRIKQVLLNLLANAVKFTPRGEVAVRCRTEQSESGQACLYVEVRDSGIGIPPDVLPHLFQPFCKASDNTVRQYGGSGLGLAICQRLIDMMQGRIGVSSQPGRGSLFWFQVPLNCL